jgi:acetylornithine deacetylase/succinyl-diaminopimelate desuccinylase-like protein
MPVSRALAYARAQRPRFVSELKEFIRFPSVSAQPARAGDVRRCALWLAAHLRRAGLSGARVYETPRRPVVYAEWLEAPGRPTVLVYGHYDVQPADPVQEWKSPPFEPEVRGPYLYGRGACDDKGQLFTHVKAVAGFYDRVREWGRAERAYMARTGPSDAEILRDVGADEAWGERGFTLYERTTVRPALTVNGIGGGYQGAGGKSVIPARAFAKLNVRLVPDQDPREIEQLIRRHIGRHTPPALRSRVTANPYARPALLDPRHPVMRAAREAYRAGFGAEPVFLRSGGTIPVVNTFQEVLGTPTVLMGFALPDDRMHAPDEKFYLPNFYRGIETSLSFLREVAQGDWRRDETPAASLCAPACECDSVSAAEG